MVPLAQISRSNSPHRQMALVFTAHTEPEGLVPAQCINRRGIALLGSAPLQHQADMIFNVRACAYAIARAGDRTLFQPV